MSRLYRRFCGQKEGTRIDQLSMVAILGSKTKVQGLKTPPVGTFMINNQ
jgi:hypothetical protein